MMKHYTLYLYRTLLLFALLSVSGTGEAWGQWGNGDIIETVTPNSEIEEIVYVLPYQPKDIILQRQGGNNNNEGTPDEKNNNIDNLDGYIRWYSKIGTGNNGVIGLTRKSYENNHQLTRYSNGYAWTREGNTGASPSAACWIECKFSQQQLDQGVEVYCDASSTKAIKERNENLIPQRISIRHKYIIRNASERVQLISEKKQALDGLNLTLTGNGASVKTLIDKPDRSAYVLNTYDIHTPNPYGTNYRLPEKLSNYFVPSARGSSQATNVRWIFYNENGIYLEHIDNTSNIISKKFDFQDQNVQHKRYILTLVKAGDQEDWYPVSFLDITLEPFSEHLTETDLQDARYKDNPNYRDRYVDDLVKQGKYELLGKAINFDTDIMNNPYDELSQNGMKYKNISSDPFSGSESFYAFAAPLEFSEKKNTRVSIGRGEYALYRTLNYDGISGYYETFTFEGNTGKYTDYFAMASLYDKQVVDRLWEKTNGQQSGYFMYLDASDEPGVIAKVAIDELCPNTSLIVTAWVCDLAHSSNASHADIGFTFKSRDKDGNETILTKYYTGALMNNPDFSAPAQSQAQWQQVAFKFSFSSGMIAADNTYILEISNNCSSSSGADYGIDDISVYRSLPDIDVQRQDACSSSRLFVSSNYETIQRNMGWDEEPNVLDMVDKDILNTYRYRKFRYGLMGPTLETDLNKVHPGFKYLGNIYYGFVKERVENATSEHWITINKHLDSLEYVKDERTKSLRVVVPSDMEKFTAEYEGEKEKLRIPKLQQDALTVEYTMNIRALRDFVQDVDKGFWKEATGEYVMDTDHDLYKYLQKALYTEGLWNSNDPSNGNDEYGNPIGAANIKEVLKDPYGLGLVYEQAVVALFNFLQIPRIRSPWYDESTGMMMLDALDVNNTDLHFANEIYYDEEGNKQTADGRYHVVLFNADVIMGTFDPNMKPVLNLADPCTLISPFYVVPSITIRVDTEAETNGVTCLGSIHTLDGTLMVANVDEYGNLIDEKMISFEEKYPDGRYTFDWFLGSMTEYKALATAWKLGEGRNLQTILYDLRDGLGEQNDTREITVTDVNNSTLDTNEKNLLLSLLGDNDTEPRLVSGRNPSFRWVQTVVAIPYVPEIPDTGGHSGKMFCTEPQEFPLADKLNVPDAPVGFPDVSYPDNPDQKPFNAPLRLGLRHIVDGTTIENIPIRSDMITFGVTGEGVDNPGHSLQMLGNKKEIQLRRSGNVYTPVGELTSLYVDKDDNTNLANALSFKFSQPDDLDLSDLFQEGETYQLYIPFGEYDKDDNYIQNSCEGYIVLDIKIVPEYLTWHGDANAVWYNDDNWKQSTEAELYKGQGNTDANGTDNIENAFAPLYFTKITIPAVETLSLENLEPTGSVLPIQADKATLNIQYDMAVDTVKDAAVGQSPYTVKPYYINKVSEIYFKPEARLQRQQYLMYDTARVEFEMTEGQKYWMASPLQAVFAGDMYAPKNTGRQETDAFGYITYSSGKNDRQSPSFYQKAWDKGVTVYTDAGGTTSAKYGVVKSNWSVEYNDVNVPYALGKGFYASVEDIEGDNGTALVRLPKADKSYTYEELKTKAASTIADRMNAGKLAGGEEITIALADVDKWEAADGNYIADGNDTETVDGKTTPGHFLLGNPYMYPLDMAKFLNVNSKVLAQKYWTLSAGGSASVGTPDIEWNEGEQTTGSIPPMQAFFVELAEGVTADEKTKVTFTPAMMAGEEDNTPATRSVITASAPVLRLTAEKDGKRSIAYLTQHDEATNKYDADKDAITLLDSELAEIPQVYTVAGDRAAGVNAVKEITNIPLGVYTDSAQDEVTLTIEGASHFINTLYLYDAQTRKSQALTGDSHTLHLTGSSHGRYFLRSIEKPTGNEAISTDAISIYSAEAGKVIVSATAPLTRVLVVSLSGQVIRSLVPNQSVSTVRLPKGIYIIHAESNGVVKTEKVMVR